MDDKRIDDLKYRNEIETFARLKGESISNLYSNSINDKVTSELNRVYNIDDLTVVNTNPTTYDIAKSHLSWDEYFMNIAILTSLRSKDTNTKVGSVLVDGRNRIIGCGYNGLPSHIDESLFPTDRDSDLPYNETKYAYIVHSELNAVLNTAVYDLTDSKLYVTLFPCCECVKVLLQKGISKIIYLSDKHHDDPYYVAARKLLDAANIEYSQYRGNILIPNF